MTLLEQAAPVRVAAANRLRSGHRGPIPPYQAPAAVRHQVGLARGGAGPRGPRYASAAAFQRRQTQRRRRDVLVVLMMSVVVTFSVGMMPRLGAVLYLNAVCDVVFVAYVALLVNMRSAQQRSRQLRMSYDPRRAARGPRYPAPSAAPQRAARAGGRSGSYEDLEYGYGYRGAPGFAMAGSGGR